MSITIHLKYPHPEGSIETGGHEMLTMDVATGAQIVKKVSGTRWRVACELNLPWVMYKDHRCTPDPKASNCPECMKTKAYADAMIERDGPALERVAVEMADGSKPLVRPGRPERAVDDAGARKPG